jgi:hypothetical protein
MAHGSSLSELSENPRSFFDGTDVKDMTRALRELIQDADLRDELHVEATQATARFTWHRTAERAWSALEQLTPHKPATNPGWPSPVGLRAEAVTDLPRSPAAVVADAESLSGLGDDPTEAALELASPLPRGVRSALAPALAVVTEQAHDLIAAGVVDLPLIGAAGLDRASAHDVHAHYAPRLHQIDLLPGQGSDIAAAMTQSARWTLQRPRMVWLLLTTSWKTEADSIRALAEAHDADLVVGGPTAVILASGADEVLVSDDLVSALLPTLLQARCRGAGIVVLGEDHPDWARSAAAPRHKGDWPAVLAEVAAGAKRRTGWPWTASGETAPHGPVGNA